MPTPRWRRRIGFIAVLLGAGNAAGGYVVTERMLEMFKPSQEAAPTSREQGMSWHVANCCRLVKVSYFVAATLFLLGLQRMASPMTARSGIQWAGLGMLIATVATFLLPGLHNHRR